MSQLTPAEFGEFFEALWGYPPYPWQARLLTRVAEGGWPHTLDLPTGSGKTAALDVAVFALALDGQLPISARTQPRRVVLVVDRRVIVDQGHQRACAIREKLASPRAPILSRVAQALSHLHSGVSGDGPLATAVLRGGMISDNDWARTPDQPLVAVSTVDQVGSRLLFRGYGVSNGMRPVHAGLLGHDTLFLLDEVHLSRPFEETLATVLGLANSKLVEKPMGLAPSVVRMSATVGKAMPDTFSLGDEDRAHPGLRQRLECTKQTTLPAPIAAPAAPEKAREKIAAACVSQAKTLFAQEGCDVVAIIVNRVHTARLAAQLASTKRWARDIEVELVTGRMRAIDRQAVQSRIIKRVGAGRKRPATQRTLLVSTQAIEAGADFDFDGLVTECASLDALRQRFGRLDRAGDLGDTARGVIVATKRDVADKAEDPIYGRSLSATWRWLESHTNDGVVDLGIAGQATRGVPPSELLAPLVHAPTLLPAYLDIWAQTSPKPEVEPDIHLFLHGPERASADVQIIWRSELVEKGNDWLTIVPEDALAACPPSPIEALSVPLWAARTWLNAVAERRDKSEVGELLAVADVEGEAAPAPSDDKQRRPFAPAILWLGADSRVLESAADLRPGQTLLVPPSYGGLSDNNWDPAAIEPVADLGDQAQLLHRGRATLRWPPLNKEGRVHSSLAPPSSASEGPPEDVDPTEVLLSWAATEQIDACPWELLRIRTLTRSRPRVVHLSPPAKGHEPRWVYIAKRPLTARQLAEYQLDANEPISDTTSAPRLSSFTGRRVSLTGHLAGVRDVATAFCTHLNLPQTIKEDLSFAGWLHDIGKADPRFQLMLHGGDPVSAAMAGELLAKSSLPAHDRPVRQRAQTRAAYPRGQRHELLSVALAEGNRALRDRAHDWELVLHLIGSHHGYCRPLAPVEHDASPLQVEFRLVDEQLHASTNHGLAQLGSQVAERFWRLVRRYGWHGLAFLEATLRLADHRRSQQESEKEADDD